MEERKQKEFLFHDKVRDEKLKTDKKEYEKLTANKKFYSVNRKSRQFITQLLLKEKRGKRILDYCCGNGDFSIFWAKNGFEVVGIDISEISINNARNAALKEGVSKSLSFFVKDAEMTEFPEDYFDIIACLGVLHHLDIKKALPELARILKPDGYIICDEPLAYNPIFQLYRRLTPHLRTEWEKEHILTKEDVNLSKKYFGKVENNFFHLFTLLAVPFRNLSCFNFILGFLEKIDSAILKLPGLKWWAWQIIFILSGPKDN